MSRLSLRMVPMVAAAVAFAIGMVSAARVDVWAQTFDLNAYKALVDANSPETVPAGTVITVHNWQQYRNFFGIGEQALYSGQYQFHVGDGPDYEVKVGAQTHFKEPTQLRADTEKYSSQTRLEPTPGGSYTIKNWVAGWPFPIRRSRNAPTRYTLTDGALSFRSCIFSNPALPTAIVTTITIPLSWI